MMALPVAPGTRGPLRTPENDPWLFTREQVYNSPSRRDGISADKERSLMASHKEYLQACARGLKLPPYTSMVATKLFQLFFMMESMAKHRPSEIASACLLLSNKICETHRKMKDVIFHTIKLRTNAVIGDDVVEGTERYKEEKRIILASERELLRTLNFRLVVENPFRYLGELCKPYVGSSPETADKYKQVFQYSWNFMTLMYSTYAHIMFDEREIASVCVMFGAASHNVELKRRPASGDDSGLPEFWDYFGCDMDRVAEICDTLLQSLESHKRSKPA